MAIGEGSLSRAGEGADSDGSVSTAGGGGACAPISDEAGSAPRNKGKGRPENSKSEWFETRGFYVEKESGEMLPEPKRPQEFTIGLFLQDGGSE